MIRIRLTSAARAASGSFRPTQAVHFSMTKLGIGLARLPGKDDLAKAVMAAKR